MKSHLLALAVFAVLAPVSVAACTAELETSCIGGNCDAGAAGGTTVAATTATTGAGGSGGAGGQGPECLACLEGLGPQAGTLPCEIETILVDKCQRCHQDPTVMGAPFPLLTYADTQTDYIGAPIFQHMHGAIKNDFMPLTPPKLTATEKATLDAWLCDCAPPGPADLTCP